MNPVSPVPAILCLLTAIVTAYILAKRFGAPPAQGRYGSIDGLRGYLAYFVFLHHVAIWYYYIRTGDWEVPPSNLYTHFGQSSVTLFFMITGFLFFAKLIEGRTKQIDWGRLFISRVMRLVPLYLLVMAIFFLIVLYLSGGTLHEPIPKLLVGMAQWTGFTLAGAPDLNQVQHTWMILAGVTWSLPYEWFFYFLLPLLALTVRVIPPIPYVILGVVAIVGLVIWDPGVVHLMSFLGGIAAALFVRSSRFRSFAQTKIASVLAIGCIALAVGLFPSALELIPILLLSAGFILIACGNTLFGALTSATSRTLGEMAYSIYLLHGIFLFVLFNFIVGLPASKTLPVSTHWLLAVGITPLLIGVCFLTFRFVEGPGMRRATGVTLWLRSRLERGERKRVASNALWVEQSHSKEKEEVRKG